MFSVPSVAGTLKPSLIARSKAQHIGDIDEPENPDRGEREHSRLEFAPDAEILAAPGLKRVIKDDQRTDRRYEADRLNEPEPARPGVGIGERAGKTHAASLIVGRAGKTLTAA